MAPATTHLRLVPAAEPVRPADEAPGDLAALFRRYSPYVAAIALRVLGRNDEVDDVVQDVFLSAMKGLGQVRSGHAVKSWLGTITVRQASRRLRRRRVWSLLRLDGGARQEVAAPGAGPEERALLQRVYRLLDRLPVAERVAWTLRHVEGEQVEQVALLCGCSLATAKRRIAAAHQAIERELGA